jgi:uncharacterized membrane protein YhaH (DUF805 family)
LPIVHEGDPLSFQQQIVPTGSAVPLWAPYYDAPIGEAARRFFKKHATFSGRASRSEYWLWTLVSGVVGFILEIVVMLGGSAGSTVNDAGVTVPGPGATVGFVLVGIWTLATLIPSLALIVRRLHDANFSGWMILIGLVPILGAIVLLVLMFLGPNPEGQRFDVPRMA